MPILQDDIINNVSLTEPGQFVLGDDGINGCLIQTKTTSPSFRDITEMVDTISVFESMFKTFVTAELVIVDKRDIIRELEITGNEFVKLKFETLGSEYPIDMMFVLSKIKDKEQISPSITKYTFSLISEAFLTNIRTKISKTLDGRFSDMVKVIWEDYFPKSDKLWIEDSQDANNKIIVPNISPVNAIRMISSFCTGEESSNASFLFFQTTKSYQFRSTASLITFSEDTPRFEMGSILRGIPPYPSPFVIGAENPAGSLIDKMLRVLEFEVSNDFDVAKFTSIGTFGSRLLEHDIYRKALYKRKFDILKDKFGEDSEKFENLNTNFLYPEGSINDADGIVLEPEPDSTVTEEDIYDISRFYDSHVNLVSSAREKQYSKDPRTESPFEALPYDTTILQRNSELTALNIQRIKIKIAGISGLQAGDIIEIYKTPSDSSAAIGGSSNDDEDIKISGKWFIESIAHNISDIYTCTIYIIRDSQNAELDPYVGFDRSSEAPINPNEPADVDNML